MSKAQNLIQSLKYTEFYVPLPDQVVIIISIGQGLSPSGYFTGRDGRIGRARATCAGDRLFEPLSSQANWYL